MGVKRRRPGRGNMGIGSRCGNCGRAGHNTRTCGKPQISEQIRGIRIKLIADDFNWLSGWCRDNDTTMSREIRSMVRQFRAENEPTKGD